MAMAEATHITTDVAIFIENSSYAQIPEDAVRIARRCILDGLALMVAGGAEHSVETLAAEVLDQGGRADALVLTRSAAERCHVTAAKAGLVGLTKGLAFSSRRMASPSIAWCPA